MLKNILYLHGFRSSPQSNKAQIMAKYIKTQHPEINWWCPQLPPSPQAAAYLISQGTSNWLAGESAIIGSSLGGFYATWLAEQKACKSVLLNPAIDPASTLKDYIGELSTWQDPNSKFVFKAEYIDELRNLYVPRPVNLANCLAIIAKGDEVLDWRLSSQYYAQAQLLLLEHSDHGLSDFKQHLAVIMQFLLG